MIVAIKSKFRGESQKFVQKVRANHRSNRFLNRKLNLLGLAHNFMN
jgi:hypothetical protein